MNVKVEARSVYGNVLLYPASPDAVLLAAIAGTKTLAPRVVALAGMMGADIAVVGGHAQDGWDEIHRNRAACESIAAVERARGQL